ncbi:hypothetical protein D3C78_1761050 [compost metagenome]
MDVLLHCKVVADHATRLVDLRPVQLERESDLLDGVQRLRVGRPCIDTLDRTLGDTGVVTGKAHDAAVAQQQLVGRRSAITGKPCGEAPVVVTA